VTSPHAHVVTDLVSGDGLGAVLAGADAVLHLASIPQRPTDDIRMAERLVAASATVPAVGHEVMHADPRDGTFTQYVDGDRLTVRMRLAESRRAIPPSERSALVPALWSRPGSDPSSIKGTMAMLERADPPTHYPMFGGVSFDGTEALWILGHRTPPYDPLVYTAVRSME
jgi:hypothetical protein